MSDEVRLIIQYVLTVSCLIAMCISCYIKETEYEILFGIFYVAQVIRLEG